MRRYRATSRDETVDETARIPANTVGSGVSSSCLFHWLIQFPWFFIISIDRVGSAGIMDITAGAMAGWSRTREIRSFFVSNVDRKEANSTCRKEGVFQDGTQQIYGGRFIAGIELFAHGDGDLLIIPAGRLLEAGSRR